MNKIGFLISGILAIMGVYLYTLGKIINLVMPKIGYLAFQMARSGSYNPEKYIIDFTEVYWVALGMVIAGVILSLIFYIVGLKKE